MLLGAVADDLTGATDLSLTLSRQGMKTLQVTGVPPEGFDFGDADAVVVALKSRTIPAADAVELSLAAARALKRGGARQIIFKYCSTFDSTAEGNIGPVAAALLDMLDAPLTIACPAFPANGRSVYRGHLFVGDVLLAESPMKDHPLTPMRDSSLVRVLGQQTDLPVGLLPFNIVDRGPEAISGAFSEAIAAGKRILIADALDERHLRDIGEAARDMALITGGSGIALGLPANFGILPGQDQGAFTAPRGRSVIIAGSCSAATRRQIATARKAGIEAIRVDPMDIHAGKVDARRLAAALIASNHPTPLIYSSDDPEEVGRIQEKLGREQAGELVEKALSAVAVLLRDAGFTRFVVAGGETSGAVVSALGVGALHIGPEIDPGVPWTISAGEGGQIALALKSGNFGADDFFVKAWEYVK